MKKEWRVDVFHAKEHNKYYFDTEAEATKFAKEHLPDNLVFLLRLATEDRYKVDADYELVCELREENTL